MAKDFERMEDSNLSGNQSIHEVSNPSRRQYLQTLAWLAGTGQPVARDERQEKGQAGCGFAVEFPGFAAEPGRLCASAAGLQF